MYTMYKNQKISQDDFTELFYELLLSERDKQDGVFTNDDITSLTDGEPDEEPRKTIIGYPTRPLYRELARLLYDWMINRHCPIEDLTTYDLLDEKTYVAARKEVIDQVTPMLDGLQSLWPGWNKQERMHRLRDVVQLLGRRGLLDLLGLRKTVGTEDTWPPSRKLLEKSFIAKHSADGKSELTVGARALSKHSHRDASTSWWGVCTGTEAAKNEHAVGLLHRILDNAHWINIHKIVHEKVIVEVRQSQGYGLRWTVDDLEFRGFLEPQMIGGHEVGWKH